MMISCPSCATNYQVDPGYLKPSGRRVRCQGCENVWFQDILSDDPEQSKEITKPEPKFDIDSEAARLLAMSQNASVQEQDRQKKKTKTLLGWGVLAASVAGFISAAVMWREPIVRFVPASADLYATLGMKVNIRGLEFENVVHQSKFENGVPVIMVRGELTNITDKTMKVPRIRIGLMDAHSQELYHWSIKASHKKLAPGKRTKFVTRLASPPYEAQHVHIRLNRTNELMAGINR